MADLWEFIRYVRNDQVTEASWGRIAGTAALAGALLTGVPQASYAKSIKHHSTIAKHYSDSDYIDAVVGEASNGGYQGMLDISCAIRNRIKDPQHSKDPLRQVFGFHANHNKSEPKEILDLARKAWNDSKTKDTVEGATLWGSASDVKSFKTQRWFKNVEPTVSRSGHTFFRVKR